MNFSDLMKHSGHVEFSPSGSQFAITQDNNSVIIYETDSISAMIQFSIHEPISEIIWSPDSQRIMMVINKKNRVIIKAISDPDWVCQIDEGVAGLKTAKWIPDSLQIMTIADYQLKCTIYNLATATQSVIKNPKHHTKCMKFNPTKKFLGIGERHNGKDYIGIYYCGDWKLLQHFQTETTDLSDLEWAGNSTTLVVWDTYLEYKVLIYSVNGDLREKIQPYEKYMGVKAVAFSPNGLYLGIGGYDQIVRVINANTWNVVDLFIHKIEKEGGTQIFEEVAAQEAKALSRYDIRETIKIKSLKLEGGVKDVPFGVGHLAWSFDSKFMVTKNDNMPQTLWIWDMSSLELHAVIVQLLPIRTFSWSPQALSLAFSTNNSKLFFWSPDGASVCDIPIDSPYKFSIAKIAWNPDGRSLIVSDKNQMILAIPVFNIGGSYHEDKENIRYQ